MINSVKDRIERELNKIFGSLNQRNWVKVSHILSKISLEIENNGYTKFPLTAIQRLYIYKRIKGINHYHILQEKLKEAEALELGFLKDANNNLQFPPKRTFNNYVSSLEKEQVQYLDSLAEQILTLATKNNIILDIELVKETITKNRKTIEQKNKEFKRAVKLVKKLVYPEIDLKIKENGKFTTKDLLDVLVHVAQTHDFTHDGSMTFKELNSESKAPSSWTMLYHFNKFESKEKIQDIFDRVLEVILNYAKQNYNILKRRKLDIAIDIHKIPYYGNKNDRYVMEGQSDKGTSHFYQFITSSIVVAGKRFTLNAILIHKLDNLEDLVDILIKKAKDKIHIGKVYLDRGFERPKVINVLKENRIKFLMPKVRSLTVKAWMRKSIGVKARIIEDFEIGTHKDKAVTRLILVNDEEGIQRAFITNLKIPVQLTHHLYNFYSKRWGIETSYRNLDHDFKAKTTSKNFHIRLFYFLFSIALYNLWVLVNIVISMALYGRLTDKPIITAKLFSVVLYRASTEDPPT